MDPPPDIVEEWTPLSEADYEKLCRQLDALTRTKRTRKGRKELKK